VYKSKDVHRGEIQEPNGRIKKKFLVEEVLLYFVSTAIIVKLSKKKRLPQHLEQVANVT